MKETTTTMEKNKDGKLPHCELTLERYFPYRLSILSNKISTLIAESYKDRFALSITEWRIMAILGEYPGVSADEISNKTQIEKSLISRAISKLLRRNLIERSLAEDDKRRSEIVLSELGLDVYNEIVPLSLKYEAELMACLTQEEKKQMSNLLDKLYKHAEALRF